MFRCRLEKSEGLPKDHLSWGSTAKCFFKESELKFYSIGIFCSQTTRGYFSAVLCNYWDFPDKVIIWHHCNPMWLCNFCLEIFLDSIWEVPWKRYDSTAQGALYRVVKEGQPGESSYLLEEDQVTGAYKLCAKYICKSASPCHPKANKLLDSS